MFSKKDLFGIINIAISQGLNYLFPILITPLAAKLLGQELFGKSLHAYYYIFYFTLLINFGLELSGAKEITLSNLNNELNKKFSAIFYLKFLLLILSILIFIILFFIDSEIRLNSKLFFVSFLFCFGSFLMPSYLFIGLEKTSLLNVIQSTLKLLLLINIYFSVTKNNYESFNLLQSTYQILTALILLAISYIKFKIKLQPFIFSDIIHLLKKSYVFFLSSISIFLYTTLNQVLVGKTLGYSTTAIFTVAARNVTGFVAIFAFPLGFYFLPKIASEFNKSKKEGVVYINEISKIYFISGIIAASSFILFNNLVLELFYSNEYSKVNNYTYVISFIPFLITMSNLFGNITFININKEKILLMITLIVGIISVSINLIYLKNLGLNLVFGNWILSELLITSLTYLYFKNYSKKILNENFS